MCVLPEPSSVCVFYPGLELSIVLFSTFLLSNIDLFLLFNCRFPTLVLPEPCSVCVQPKSHSVCVLLRSIYSIHAVCVLPEPHSVCVLSGSFRRTGAFYLERDIPAQHF